MQESIWAAICSFKAISDSRNENTIHPSGEDRRGLSPPVWMHNEQPLCFTDLTPMFLNQRVFGTQKCLFQGVADSVSF
jgi:hypothetical protein